MGRGHAASGALAFTALVAAAPLVGVHPSVAQTACGAFATAGAALIPDSDHPEGTIAFTWGPLSKALCEAIHNACHGHRRHTHTLPFAALAGGCTWLWLALAAPFHATSWVAGVMLYALLTLAMRSLKLAHAGAHPLGAALAYLAVEHTHGLTTLLPLAVTLGCLAHIAGDSLTVEGVPPFLWPLRPMGKHVRFPILGHAGSRRELLLTPWMVIGALVLPFVHLWIR